MSETDMDLKTNNMFYKLSVFFDKDIATESSKIDLLVQLQNELTAKVHKKSYTPLLSVRKCSVRM